jgi:hypothetical protein
MCRLIGERQEQGWGFSTSRRLCRLDVKRSPHMSFSLLSPTQGLLGGVSHISDA